VLNYLYAFRLRYGRRDVKSLKVHRVDSPDGEIHIIIEETLSFEDSECFADVAEIKKVTRKEAAKPLVLFREE
jgi:hypothetical protein